MITIFKSPQVVLQRWRCFSINWNKTCVLECAPNVPQIYINVEMSNKDDIYTLLFKAHLLLWKYFSLFYTIWFKRRILKTSNQGSELNKSEVFALSSKVLVLIYQYLKCSNSTVVVDRRKSYRNIVHLVNKLSTG